MNERIRLTGRVPIYLARCSYPDSEMRKLAREEVRTRLRLSADDVWHIFVTNSAYSHMANFSSRPLGNEEHVYVALMAMPPEFSREILRMYEAQGYLERRDVDEAYRSAAER